MTSNTVLVPLDGSPESNAALPLARVLAGATHASIVLLRVVAHDDPETLLAATEGLRKLASECEGPDVEVVMSLRSGHAAEEILSEIKVRHASMAVMRTHGRSGIERAILGSVAEKVLAHSPVPVVLMRPGEREPTRIHRLLVPVDGSPGGGLALDAAASLASATGASVELIQVVVPIALQGVAAYDYAGGAYYDPKLDEQALADASDYVEGAAARLRRAGVIARGEAIAAPNAAQAIIDQAERRGADLVLMSTRALTGPARALMGSVANTVVRTANCPVLLVHRRDESETISKSA
jgi:nucleotide-binding universal stress UspA family protein